MMAGLLLLALTALLGCASEPLIVYKTETVTYPPELFQPIPWPLPPSQPMNCEWGGKPTVCQSQLFAWIEGQVRADFDELNARLEAIHQLTNQKGDIK